MKKKVLFLFLLGIFSLKNFEVNGGILGTRGKYIVESDGSLCCGYSWFSNQCSRQGGDGWFPTNNVYRCEGYNPLT